MTNDDKTAVRVARPFPPKWLTYAAFGLFALVVLLAGLFGYGLVQSEHDVAVVSAQRQQTIEQLSKNNDALRTQVQKLGQKPIAPPAAQVISDSGKNGINGSNGQNGRGVVSFTCQADSSWLILYTDATTQTVVGPCVGATGAAGAAGADSTVPGPAGVAGASGADGQPPFSWEYTDGLGLTYACTRTDPFDPSNPTYSCSRD